MAKLVFRGRSKETQTRIEGTGVNEIDGELYLLDGTQILCPIERSSMRISDPDRNKCFDNPITTQENLAELQRKLMEVVIDYCKENKLTDIDAITFSTDTLQASIAYGKWVPSTDAAIAAYGYEEGTYKKIGEWL